MSTASTDFEILSGITVPRNYTWDSGVPFASEENTVPAFTNSQYISGYAPGVKVAFKNLSISDPTFDTTSYNWNLGDYYNDTTNFPTLTGTDSIEHTFVMPGRYNVRLQLQQTRINSDEIENDKLCRGKYGVRWFWNDLTCESRNNIKWDETTCVKLPNVTPERWKRKWWDNEIECFQRHCLVWSWEELSRNRGNPVRWSETTFEREYEKKWEFERNDTVCSVDDTTYLDTLTAIEQTTIKRGMVEVFEIPPVAGMHSLTRPATGNTPLTLYFTISTCKPGSFPIDHIDINFGDGSETLTLTRYASNTAANVQWSTPRFFPNDPEDIRNYIISHTYTRNKDTYPIFYPSLSCYSACTNRMDTCSITVGPVTSPSLPIKTTLLKVRNTPKNNLYVFSTNENIAFLTTAAVTGQDVQPTPNRPTTPFNDTYYTRSTLYRGNSGNGYLNAPDIELE